VKVLLDENLPHKLRAHLSHHETATVAYLGWGGLSNGELLQAAENAGFDVFLTGDTTLEYQQNPAGRRVAIVSLSTPNWPIIRHHVKKIAVAIECAVPGSITRLNCGSVVRRRRTK
jgi:hypothetical protein